jgi:very-short-patch-repair endonuclease
MNLTFLVIIVAIVVLVAVVLAALKVKGSVNVGPAKSEVYDLRKSLFSPAERSFLGVLETLDYDGVRIACKVRLADVFLVKKGLERSERQRAQNRINAKHVDFVLIQQSDGRPLLGIELDDRSHEEEDRVARDSFVDSVFSSAGLPILHVTAKAVYDPRDVHRQIDAALEKAASKKLPRKQGEE